MKQTLDEIASRRADSVYLGLKNGSLAPFKEALKEAGEAFLLKPCKTCSAWFRVGRLYSGRFIACSGCGWGTGWCYDMAEAVLKWNERQGSDL